MFFLISNDKIIFKGESTSLSEFKKSYPIHDGLSAASNEYIEISTDIFYGLTGYSSQSGTTAGMGATFATIDLSGITYSESFIRGDLSERMNVLGIDPSNPLALNDGFFAFSNSDVGAAAGDLEITDNRDNTDIEFDPRLSPSITLDELQSIKELESENSFLDEGLGATASISFEKDDGGSQSLVFDNRRDTILDLLTIKQYSDLNLSIVNQSSQTSVVVTGIKIIDNEGTITSLSPTEFDKCLHAVLAEFYENYITRTDMKNVVKNPVGATDAEKISYLQDSTNVSFTVSSNSSFAQAASGK